MSHFWTYSSAMLTTKEFVSATTCFHCGEVLPPDPNHLDEKEFCCIGCLGVYRILNDNNLGDYYIYNDIPGQTQRLKPLHYEYLDEPEIAAKLVDYKDDRVTIITLYIPAIHCSSCIWLLESLHKLNTNIVQSRVDFLKKQVVVTFKNQELSLKGLVETLCRIGYEPIISLQDVIKEQQTGYTDRKLITRIAVAGFCFGNTMLLSFPEYFGLADFEQQFKSFFGLMNIAFAIPVVFYSGREYFVSAWLNLKKGNLNLDFPLALGILVMFLRSLGEIATHTGAGFVDTLCGLVFFLLIGKWMQEHTYHHLSFERDYRSYFPVAVTLLLDSQEKPIPLAELKKGDRILIRSNEIIPADAILLKGHAKIDFSFVTGESKPVDKVLGEIVYAGGRQLDGAIELEVVKSVSQSYLTSLWNNESFHASKDGIGTFSGTASRYFSIVLLLIAVGSGAFWMYFDPSKAMAAFSAVLIIACPCALALSSPFTLAAVLSIFDKNKFYLKNTAVVEELARIDTFIFDKTGTISNPDAAGFSLNGELDQQQLQLIHDLARNSGHPLSRELVKWLDLPMQHTVEDYREMVGRGLSGGVNGHTLRLGSLEYLGLDHSEPKGGTRVHVLLDGEYAGNFAFNQRWRGGLKELLLKLQKTASLYLLSGDQDHDRQYLITLFPDSEQMQFRQSPQNKLDFIKNLQVSRHKVAMFGDGLNDAGALKQSDVGIAVTDNINNFSPGCEAILDGESFSKIPAFIQQAKDAVRVIHMSFAISLVYNILGLSFAVQGILSPLIAAILMPASTVTIILFTSIAARLYARKNGLL
jgi:Cu+-exporting ATPase